MHEALRYYPEFGSVVFWRQGSAIWKTEQGVLLIQGDELHVNRLLWRREKSILMGGSTVLLILTGRKLRKKQLLFWAECFNDGSDTGTTAIHFVDDVRGNGNLGRIWCFAFVSLAGATWHRVDRCGRSVFLGRCQCSGIYFILKNARWTDQMVWCGCAA